jgi:2-polyprenyl-6-methoxyphenol hydroxylase-like FAD-dependent oxidoreductase
MARDDQTEVLVVGAGPVGMLTALLLAENGVHVKIIDKEPRTATHSYACVLHPATLRLLHRMDLAKDVLAHGRRLDTVAFYQGADRRAEIKLSQLPGEYPYALVLPQNRFEDLLEQRLRQIQQPVLWNHRLENLQRERDSVLATFNKLAQSAKGYIVAEWDWEVQKTLQVRPAFLVGADGHGSIVRSRTGIDYERVAGPELFAVFEFETDSDPGNEVRIVLDEYTTNVLWPLPGNACRWSFQLVKSREGGDFPEKERQAARFVRETVDDHTRERVELLAQKRAPWFKGNIKDFYWWAHIRFQGCLAKPFGNDRVWLAGDAAHQTGPVGGQSMNAGLLEGADLADRLSRILREGASRELLEAYSREHREDWQRLLGVKAGLSAGPQAGAWAKAHAARVLPCLPALGEDLARVADQLGFAY